LTADFELRDNGVIQKVALVSFEQIPLNIVLVFDLSTSVSGQRLEDLRRAGHGLLDGLKKDDQAALITLSQAVTQESALGRDLARLRAALDSAQPLGATALVDASFTGMMVGESTTGRALIMVFRDGIDTSSWLSPERVLDIAKQSDVVVYGIAAGRHKSPFLPDLASATGGRMLEVDSTRNLAGVFANILEEFRQRYVLTYEPRGVEKAGWHRLEVRVKRRGVKVNARPGYQSGPAVP
jgi:Ca-activated chloride channel family protein